MSPESRSLEEVDVPLAQLTRTRWHDFFEAASQAIAAQDARVEITGLGVGDRIAADWVPLNGITYEPGDDTLTLFLEGLEHRIHHPRAIHVDENFDTVTSIHAVDAEGNHHVVQFSAPLELNAP